MSMPMPPKIKNILSVLVLIGFAGLIWWVTRPDVTIPVGEGASTVFQTTLPNGDVVKHYTKNGDKVGITDLQPFDTVNSPLTVRGQANGSWFFEGSFPVHLIDRNGNEIAQAPAKAQGEWMTTDFVPFEVTLNFNVPEAGGGYLILEKDNPSGLPENAARYEFPVSFATQPVARDNCVVTGCSGELCADEEKITTCVFLPEYVCYRSATCARQANGKCGWTETATLSACLSSYGQR